MTLCIYKHVCLRKHSPLLYFQLSQNLKVAWQRRHELSEAELADWQWTALATLCRNYPGPLEHFGTARTACSKVEKCWISAHSVFMCFVWISEQTAIISLYSINSVTAEGAEGGTWAWDAEETGEWRELHNEELHYLIVWATKGRGQVAGVGEKRNAYRIW
jgi:hypothetical protein